MNTSQSFSADQNMVIQLEVVSDEEQPADIADVDEVGRSLFDHLTQSGYTVKPASTGRRGGGPLFDILLAIPQVLYDSKDWLLESLPPVIECLLIARNRRAERERAKRSPVTITLEIDGKSVVIDVKDTKEAADFVEQLQKKQHDRARIKVRVPKKKRHL